MQPQATPLNSIKSSAPASGSAAASRLLAALKRTTYFFPAVGLIAVCLVMVVTTENFFSADNFLNIARQVSINAIIAVGMTCAILSGGIDLAVGSVMALSGTLMAGLMVAGVPPYAAILLGLGVGLAVGLFNGFFIADADMPPVIVTLATMGIARGLALIYTGGYPIDGLPEMFAFFGRGSVLGIQTPVVIMLLTL